MSITTLIVIILVVLLLGGGGYGWRSGAYSGGTFGGGIGLVVLILLVWLVVGGRF